MGGERFRQECEIVFPYARSGALADVARETARGQRLERTG
jgi:hypothetical protein